MASNPPKKGRRLIHPQNLVDVFGPESPLNFVVISRHLSPPTPTASAVLASSKLHMAAGEALENHMAEGRAYIPAWRAFGALPRQVSQDQRGDSDAAMTMTPSMAAKEGGWAGGRQKKKRKKALDMFPYVGEHAVRSNVKWLKWFSSSQPMRRKSGYYRSHILMCLGSNPRPWLHGRIFDDWARRTAMRCASKPHPLPSCSSRRSWREQADPNDTLVLFNWETTQDGAQEE
ncbi:hypothetical protein MKZ38_010043 [Zalerion maritima]|uniref:Uncharacterized protein n=1 Tax=Zalerion maritima TaxID=339359 RepID=A0AAD5RGG3_9PEZI|nr:hypothetical protein MKZ38_010043 [Zalerion maritima]